MKEQINCFIIDIINLTLASCDYSNCDDSCRDYLMNVANNCPVIFHNQGYLNLWNTLFHICFPSEEVIMNYFSVKH